MKIYMMLEIQAMPLGTGIIPMKHKNPYTPDTSLKVAGVSTPVELTVN